MSQLQVVVSCGPEDVARAEFALQTALAAACSGVEVTVFFTLRGSRWACAQPVEGEAAALSELIERLRGFGAQLECCSRCLEKVCGQELDVDQVGGVDPRFESVGLTPLAVRAAQGQPTMVF